MNTGPTNDGTDDISSLSERELNDLRKIARLRLEEAIADYQRLNEMPVGILMEWIICTATHVRVAMPNHRGEIEHSEGCSVGVMIPAEQAPHRSLGLIEMARMQIKNMAPYMITNTEDED